MGKTKELFAEVINQIDDVQERQYFELDESQPIEPVEQPAVNFEESLRVGGWYPENPKWFL